MGIIYDTKLKILEFVERSIKLTSDKNGNPLPSNKPLILDNDKNITTGEFPEVTSDTVKTTPNGTTKAYLTGTTKATESTGTLIFDDEVYLDTEKGQLVVKSIRIGDAVLSYDKTEERLKVDFI